MPSRTQVFTCYCESCKEAGPLGCDGEPLGVVFPISQRTSHLARIKAERDIRKESLPTYPVHSSTQAEITTTALVDSMTELSSSKSEVSRFWASRNDYQDHHYVSESANTISASIIDTIAEGFGRLALEPSINDLIGPVEQISLTPGINSSTPHPLSNFSPPTPKSSTSTRRETKRERNAYTKKAHLTLNHVENSAHSCLKALAHVKSNAELVPIEGEIALLRQAFDGVTREVPSVDT